MLAGHDRFAFADREGALQVKAARQVAVIGRALHKPVPVQRIGLHAGTTGKAQPIAVSGNGGRDTLQRVTGQVLAVGERCIVVASAVTVGAAAHAGGPTLARRAECQAEGQVKATIAGCTGADAGGTVKYRKSPVAVAAQPVSDLRPAQIQPYAVGITLAMGQPGIHAAFRGKAVVQGKG